MIENIQKLYKQVEKKSDFIVSVAKEVGNTPLSTRTHWFSNFWSIPEEYQCKVVEMLQKTIAKQNSQKQEV